MTAVAASTGGAGHASPRGARLSRADRRRQLLAAALQVFVARGYHATVMDEIAERAGVSKPVLYQHFPGKRELYLALLDETVDEMVTAVRAALNSTTDNARRVEAVAEAFFEFVDREGQPFRLLFESDLISDDGVRERLERMNVACSEPIGEVIADDTGLPTRQARLLAAALVGQAQVAARWWLAGDRRVPRAQAAQLVATLSWRGIGGFPKSDD